MAGGLAALRGLARVVGPGAVVTIGNFDGVHRGHRALLANARRQVEAAADDGRSGGRVVAVTFDPPPGAVLRPGSEPMRLTPLDVKIRLLKEAGADEVVVLPPDRELLEIEAEDFFAILRDDARVGHLVEGDNFCFGKGRKGTVDRLREWGGAAGIGVTVVRPVEVCLLDMRIVAVSSSLIRWLVAVGRVRDAGICLGGPVRLVGKVVTGFQRGRTIGFATANLDPAWEGGVGNIVPGDGVYAGRAVVGSVAYPVALNIGPIPTFSDQVRQIEAHLIGFTGDLYGQVLEVEVLDFLRDARKFAGIEALKTQLARDVAHAIDITRRTKVLQPLAEVPS